DVESARRALRAAGLRPAQEQEQRFWLRSARAGAGDLHRHGHRYQRARSMGLRVDGADPGPQQGTARAVRQGDQRILRRASDEAGRGGKPLMVLDPAAAAKITGPAAIDGIGPSEGWQVYWRKTDEARRQASSWANQKSDIRSQ